MTLIRWTPQASDDLQAIYDYIARDFVVRASAEAQRILEAIDQLDPFPVLTGARRLVVDQPTSLPEGAVVDLVIDDEGDDLDAKERAALHAALERGWASARAGKGRDAEEVLRDLRKRSAG